jgi:hypothetical protein
MTLSRPGRLPDFSLLWQVSLYQPASSMPANRVNALSFLPDYGMFMQ